MKLQIRLLSLLAVAFIIAEATLPPYLLFGASGAGIAFNAYIAFGLGLFVFGAVSQRLDRDEERQRLEDELLKQARRGRAARFRTMLYTSTLVILGITCWPATQFGLTAIRIASSSRRTNSDLGLFAGLSLFPLETSVSIFTAVATAILTVIASYKRPPFVFSIMFFWIIIFSVFLKHLSSLIGGDTVQAKLRRGLDPVMVSYALIVAGDLIALILSYNGIVYWNSGSVFDRAAVQSIFQKLLVFKDFVAAYEHPPNGFLAYCIGVSGLLWWSTLAQGLFQFTGYQRTPSDYLNLASNCTLLGKDDRARTFLEAANATTKEECEQKGLIYAARGEFDRAAFFIKKFLNQTDIEPVSESYILLKMVGGMIILRATQDRYYQFVEYGADHGLTNSLLSWFVMTWSADDSRTFADRLRQPKFDRFRLTWFFLKCMADEGREILDEYQQSEPREPVADRALWLCIGSMLWRARRTTDDETAQFVKNWSGPMLDEICRIGVSIPGDIDKCALVDVLQMAKRFWFRIGVNLIEIDKAVAAIAQSLPNNEVIAKIKAAWLVVAPVSPP